MVVCHGDGFAHYLGNKKEGFIKNYLQFEIQDVNDRNKYGETLLFVASYFCEYDIVTALLNMGADPNIQNSLGNTSLHAAAYFNNLKLLQLLVSCGGDLRIANNEGFRPTQLMKNYKHQNKLKSYEHNLYVNLLSYLTNKPVSISPNHKKITMFDSFPKIKSITTVHPFFSCMSGFGNFYCINKKVEGLITSIPIIYDSQDLVKDLYTPELLYSNDMILCNKTWGNEPVTVKQMKSKSTNVTLYSTKMQLLSNLLIKEAQNIGSLRHPNILLLMCINLKSNDTIPIIYYQLIFERAHRGTLYHAIHIKKYKFNICQFQQIFSQILNAINFLHKLHLLHLSISSYAVYLVNEYTYKLGNFEYAVDSRNHSNHKSFTLPSNQLLENVHRWLAPELFNTTHTISTATDVYGLATVMWETFSQNPPHLNKQYKSIVNAYEFPFSDNSISQIPINMRNVLTNCLNFEPFQRPKLHDIQRILTDGSQSNTNYESDFTTDCSEPLYSVVSKKSSIINSLNDDKTGFSKNRSFNDKIENQSLISSNKGYNRNDRNAKNDSLITETSDLIETNSKYTTISNKSILTIKSPLKSNAVTINNEFRKSHSYNCLSPEKFSTSDSNADVYFTKRKHRRRDSFIYKEFAAIPTHNDDEPCIWKYPGPQTEYTIEGQGNLSNNDHRTSITRGMKPASHQTGLTTSQTNISSITGKSDLIKASSRSNLFKQSTSSFLSKIPSFSTSYKTINSISSASGSPLSSKMKDLIVKYDHCSNHPYISSNSSTPVKNFVSVHSTTSKISTETLTNPNNKTLSPNSFAKNNNTQYCVKYSSNNEENENTLIRDIKEPFGNFPTKTSKSMHMLRLFGDITNRYHK